MMELMEFDSQELYCRKLGHELSFGYCRAEHTGLPCPKLVDCWGAVLPLDAWLGEHFPPEEIGYIGEPPPPKLTTLLELIRKAQNRE